MPKTVNDIEQYIRQLTPMQLKQFRAWYEEFDADAWDKQIAEDACQGKLDTLASTALKDHETGLSREM